jgi:hypothetical protein
VSPPRPIQAALAALLVIYVSVAASGVYGQGYSIDEEVTVIVVRASGSTAYPSLPPACSKIAVFRTLTARGLPASSQAMA